METIAQIAYNYLIENGFDSISYGDTYNLDAIAQLCKHSKISNLKNYHPLDRHEILLNSLEKSKLFSKCYLRHNNRLYRSFDIVKNES